MRVLGAIAVALIAFGAVHTNRAAAAARYCPYAARPYPTGPMRPTVGHLTIGAIGLSTPIFQGFGSDLNTEASKSLMYGPAIYPLDYQWSRGHTNSLPGQGGTVGMSGHRTTRTHPFCLAAELRPGHAYATIQMKYGTFKYRLVASKSLPGSNDSAFVHPARFDPRPRRWPKGIKPEYLVIGACDPPHSAARRINLVFKLVAEYA